MIRTRFASALLAALVLGLSSVTTAQSGAPSIAKIGPSTIAVGDPDFTLRVTGENFDATSVVLLDGTPVQTFFISKKRLHARMPASLSDAPGSHTIAVRTGAGATTGTQALSVAAKAPGITIDRVNPDSFQVVNVSNAFVIFRVGGAGLNEDSKVLVYGQALTTRVHEKNVLEAEVLSTLFNGPGLMPFQVRGAGGALSNLHTVSVFGRPAEITALSPSSVTSGSEAFTLTLTGTGFSKDARVLVNGVELQPTSVKAQTLKVQVPASVVSAVDQVVVYVTQATGLSNAVILRVTPASGAPVVYTVSPDEIQAGAGARDVQISGANFGDKSVVLVNGAEAKTTFVGRATLTFRLTEAQTSAPDVTYTIQVRTNDGTVSNVATVDVVEAAVVSTASGEKLDGFVDGGPQSARFRRPSRVAVGPDGHLYVADQQNHAVRRVDPSTGVVETLAGDGQAGYVDSGDSTKPTLSVPRFNNPLGVAVAPDGTVYVADYGNQVIRRIRATGGGFVVDTVAGRNERIDSDDTRTQQFSTRRGLQGYADGAGAAARFRGPDGMALASDGLLYVADAQNHYIRAIDTRAAAFTVSTVSGLGINGFTDGDRDTARYTLPVDVALTPDEGRLVVADFGTNRVRLIDLATGVVSTLAGSGLEGVASGPPLVAAYRGPVGVTVAADGTVYVADTLSNTIRKIDLEGTTSTLAGGGGKTKFKDGIGPEARFKDPRGLVYHEELGVLFVVDQGHHRIRRIEP